jgi:tetrahydromethanopterin S-methyltransferase subunit F
MEHPPGTLTLTRYRNDLAGRLCALAFVVGVIVGGFLGLCAGIAVAVKIFLSA